MRLPPLPVANVTPEPQTDSAASALKRAICGLYCKEGRISRSARVFKRVNKTKIIRPILFCLLVMFTVPAWAEWEEVAESDSGTSYIDPTTIRKVGTLRRFWEVFDFKTVDVNGGMSMRRLNEYDCATRQYKILSMTEHSKPMAGGSILVTHNNTTGKWARIAPKTIAEKLLTTVCG